MFIFELNPGNAISIYLAYHGDENRCGVPRFREVLPHSNNFAGNKGTNAYLLYTKYVHVDNKIQN